MALIASFDNVSDQKRGNTFRPTSLLKSIVGRASTHTQAFEVVTKLRGPELSAKAQIAELMAAMLADWLGLDVPQAAMVDVPVGFDAIVSATHAPAFRASTGANFGSVHLGTSFTTWLMGRTPIGQQRDQAAAIFAFDLLVQNPDRRATNPNLWSRSDCLGVYDHEQAFSFLHLPIIGGAPRPWVLADQAAGFRFMENHIFYPALRGGRLDLGSFEAKLAALSEQAITRLLMDIPAAWGGDDFASRVAYYLEEAREERTAFLNFVKHLLR